MYQRNIGSYDEIPQGMKSYINNYGCHFNKKLYKEAVSRMFKKKEGAKISIEPYSKEQIDRLLESYDIRLERNKLYDSCYIASMCAADYLGSSIVDEKHMAMFIKDAVDDPDACDGLIFNRWYADQMFMNNPIDWDTML